MGIVRRYRLFSLSLLIIAVLAVFLAFFFVWVLAPLLVIGIGYLAFVMTAPGQRLIARLTRGARWERRQRLVAEARARREMLDRKIVKIERTKVRGSRAGR